MGHAVGAHRRDHLRAVLGGHDVPGGDERGGAEHLPGPASLEHERADGFEVGTVGRDPTNERILRGRRTLLCPGRASDGEGEEWS
jgi:hypothetical protein